MSVRHALALTLLLATGASQGAVFEFSGRAVADGGKPLYSESHRIEGHCKAGRFHPDAHSARYVKPDAQKPFATKQLDYRSSPLRPVVDFEQPDFAESLEIRYPESGLASVKWRSPKGVVKRFEVPHGEDLVVDSGFDQFVRQHWQEIRAGEPVTFRFLAPTRGEHFAFVVEPASDTSIDSDVVVRLRPTSVILRLVVDPILLGYTRQGALTDYVGLTNIRRNQEENHTAHIRYQVERMPDCALTE